jgi:hypothetical protein
MPSLTSDRHHIIIPPAAVAKADRAPEGISTITYGGHSYRVNRDPKMISISPDFSRENLKDGADFHVVVFPRPEHREAFRRAEAGLAGHGLARFNPGALGTVTVESRGKYEPLNIPYIQSHYKSSGPHGVGSKLARSHLGWFERGVKEALDVAQNMGRELEIHNHAFYRGERDMGLRKEDRIKQLDSAIEKIKLERGVSEVKRPLGVLLKLPKQRHPARRHK